VARPEHYDCAYLDSCVLSRYCKRDEGWQRVQQIMDAADQGQIELYVSMFSYVECLSQTPTPNPDIGTEARVRERLDSERMNKVEFSRAVALHARELHLTHQYKLGDAIHIASALEAEVDVLFTFDKDDFPIGERVGGVWVDLPYLAGDPSLFDPE
jgi:predicted nucleic acid-binding protein